MKIGRRKRDQDRSVRREPLINDINYSTKEDRERTVATLFSEAKNARTMQETEWIRFNDYYNFLHDASQEIREYCEENDMPFIPAVVSDPWVMVESQIDPSVPDPEFHGRDTDKDSEKAKQREYAVKYIVENNRLKDMNTANERRLLKYGDAFWKAYWDSDMRCGINEGDIRIIDVPVEAMYPDPAIGAGEIQDGEYLDYVYRMPVTRFYRTFRRELKKLDLYPDELTGSDYTTREDLFAMATPDETARDRTVQIIEHWFRQPEDITDGETKEKISAGAIGCTIQVAGKEIKYIPNYWKNTGRQCQLFPFVQYWRVNDENSVWNKSELYPILSMVDAADRKLSTTILSELFTANDIILMEDGALADDTELTNEPGAVVKVKQGRINAISRLGGMQSVANGLNDMSWFRGEIERTNRQYDSNMGKETARVTTATGLAMLRSDAKGQADIKSADRNAGFERLYELLDWLALEFYDDDRLIYLGADEDKGRDEPVSIRYNARSMSDTMPEVTDVNGKVVREAWEYYPKVDVTITAGDSVVKGKQETLNALATLTQMPITADNWQLFAAQLQILDIPNKQDIIEMWEGKFQGALTEEEQAILAQDPQLKAMVEQLIQSAAQNQQAQGGGAPAAAEMGMPGAMPAEMPGATPGEMTGGMDYGQI